jgi:hypothetical protein
MLIGAINLSFKKKYPVAELLDTRAHIFIPEK